MKNTNNNEIQTNLLEEIHLKPSQQIEADRFSIDAHAANCSGMCSSGMCHGFAASNQE